MCGENAFEMWKMLKVMGIAVVFMLIVFFGLRWAAVGSPGTAYTIVSVEDFNSKYLKLSCTPWNEWTPQYVKRFYFVLADIKMPPKEEAERKAFQYIVKLRKFKCNNKIEKSFLDM